MARGTWAAALLLAVVLLVGCTHSRDGADLTSTAAGHLGVAGGPAGVRGPAAGLKVRAVDGRTVKAAGVTDARGDFRFALPPGHYVLMADWGGSCPSPAFSVPMKHPLSIVCDRQ
jgi:hypothetical protein